MIKNPYLKVSWQRQSKTLINTFTDLEVINMVNAFNYLNYLNARNKTIIAFLVDTGARNAETCSILSNNIKDNYVLIQGKGNKERQVGLIWYPCQGQYKKEC
ncbi:MAG: tyrosine-type recombinase/integrase [Clostridium sp.]|uniref:tyrosine-type recombinase/integrase n=1 Tax=Clostridium sp. TaxID=1506 RepID=UPI003D6C7F8F